MPLGVTVIDGAVAANRGSTLCITLGGDGTILRALRAFTRHAGAGVRGQLRAGRVPRDRRARRSPRHVRRRARRPLRPARRACGDIAVEGATTSSSAINDVSVHRRPGARVAETGLRRRRCRHRRVRCDGLVACTPAGSTGYNLANGGPILAWGVEGYGVSFIAPHSLTARSIVVSRRPMRSSWRTAARMPSSSRSTAARRRRPRRTGRRARSVTARSAAILAQLPDSSFYARLREKFGHLRG